MGAPWSPIFGCTTIGNCLLLAAGGPVGWTETNGIWGHKFRTEFGTNDTTYIDMNAVACPNATTCIAVGPGYANSTEPYPVYSVATNGTWGPSEREAEPVLSPVLKGAEFDGIACDQGSCLAVGVGGTYGDWKRTYLQPIAATWSKGR